jgi:hypothetical protein
MNQNETPTPTNIVTESFNKATNTLSAEKSLKQQRESLTKFLNDYLDVIKDEEDLVARKIQLGHADTLAVSKKEALVIVKSKISEIIDNERAHVLKVQTPDLLIKTANLLDKLDLKTNLESDSMIELNFLKTTKQNLFSQLTPDQQAHKKEALEKIIKVFEGYLKPASVVRSNTPTPPPTA